MDRLTKNIGMLLRVLIIAVNIIFVGGQLTTHVQAAGATNLNVRSLKQTTDTRKKDIIGDLEKLQRDGGNLSDRLAVRFSEIRKTDVSVAGGKGANLGELQHVKGIRVPDGFAVTTKAFKIHINSGTVNYQGKTISLREFIDIRLKDLNYEDTIALNAAAQEIRDAIEKAEMPIEIKNEIAKWYQKLCDETGIKDVPVAVRSSATAEDMEGAAFAGQQDTYLNMRGIEDVLDAVKRDWASLFTARSVFYRHNMGIAHDEAFLSAVIQLMVDAAKAGTTFGVDLTTGMPAVEIDAGWGLGEGIVSGSVTGDHYKLVYDTKTGKPKLLEKTLGSKLNKYVYKKERGLKAKEGTDFVETTPAERKKFTLTKREAIKIANAQKAINAHYGMYMDVEWAIDAKGRLFILQARPETIWNELEKEYPDTVVTIVKEVPEEDAKNARVLFSGIKGARKAGAGKVVIVKADEMATPAETAMALARELDRVKPGDVMVTKMTKPDMVPAMKRASAIVTDEGGPTCHAAIVARELRIPCLVGTSVATKILKEGQEITVDGNRGKVFDRTLPLVERRELEPIDKLPVTEKTKLGIINSEPDLAMEIWQFSKYPSYAGYNLFRKEFVDTTEILAHPLAGLDYDRYNDPKFKDEAKRKWIKENVMDVSGDKIKAILEGGPTVYKTYQEFYIDKLSKAIAKVASAQMGGQKIKYRTTDFKTNEYSLQTGALPYEPNENNPMMGYRGIFRMMHPNYNDAFRLEVKAIKKALEIQPNIDIMFPVVRTVEELTAAVKILAEEGIFDVKDKPKIGMMVEVPANIFQAEDFYAALKLLAEKYGTSAFMSIGSNDLTQFTLGLGRDNDKMDKFFSEADPAVKKGIEIVIKTAKKYGIETGLCGQRPSNDPEFAGFLSSAGIDSIGVAPDAFGNVVRVVAQVEAEQANKPYDPNIAGWELPRTVGHPRTIMSAEIKAADIIAGVNTHPLALLESYRSGNKRAKDMVVDAVYEALMAQAKVAAKDMPVIYASDDADRTAYEKLQDGKKHETALQEMDENPQLGFLGLARVVDADFQEFFRWQLEGVQKARADSGRNIGIKLSTPTNLSNVQDALKIMKEKGLVPGQNGLLVGIEIAKPANVLLLNEFIDLGVNFLSENGDRLLSYLMALDPGSPYVNYSDKLKEKALSNPRRIWTTIAERRGIPIIQETTAYVNALDKRVYSEFEPVADSAASVLKDVKVADEQIGIVVIGANAVLDNAGTYESLKKFKDAQPGLKAVVWGEKPATDRGAAELNSSLAATSIAKEAVIMLNGMEEVLESIGEEYNIGQGKIMLMLSEKDVVALEKEYDMDIKEFLDRHPLLKATIIKDSASGEAAPMTLAFANLLARNLKVEAPALGSALARLTAMTYKDASSAVIAAVTDLTANLVTIMPVNVDAETAQAAQDYKDATAVARKLDIGV